MKAESWRIVYALPEWVGRWVGEVLSLRAPVSPSVEDIVYWDDFWVA